MEVKGAIDVKKINQDWTKANTVYYVCSVCNNLQLFLQMSKKPMKIRIAADGSIRRKIFLSDLNLKPKTVRVLTDSNLDYFNFPRG